MGNASSNQLNQNNIRHTAGPIPVPGFAITYGGHNAMATAKVSSPQGPAPVKNPGARLNNQTDNENQR